MTKRQKAANIWLLEDAPQRLGPAVRVELEEPVSGAALLSGVTHADYHADAIPGHPGPHFSRSLALALLNDSPMHAWFYHPLLGGQRKPHKESSVAGSLLHGVILGTGPEIEVVQVHTNPQHIGPRVDAQDYKKPEAQEIKRAAIARGAVPVLRKEWNEIELAVSILTRRLETLGVPLEAPEGATQYLEGTIVFPFGGVPCKVRPDNLLLGRGPDLYDLKFTGGGKRPVLNPAGWRARMKAWGCDIQWFLYGQGVVALRPELAGRVDLQFVVMEAVPPYDAWVQPVGKTMQQLGEDRTMRALLKWRPCVESGTWPGHGIQPPAEAKPWDFEEEFSAAVAAAGDPAWVEEEAADGRS